MFIFVSSKDEDKLYVPKAMTIWSKGPSIESCEGDQSASGATWWKGEDREEISMTWPRSARKTEANSDPKGKKIPSSPEKTKKTKETQIEEVPKRKENFYCC